MTPERHQQIKRLFLAAVELAPEEVQPFLDGACGTDPSLRDEVDELLAHHQTKTLLEDIGSRSTVGQLPGVESTADQTAISKAATSPQPRPAGTIIAGRYRLVAPLGQGGMGIVYRAEDLELEQTIALKFLSPALQEHPGAVEMLRSEVRNARQVTHPNVVRIFDIGSADGELFLSMEFVAGEDLGSLVRRIGPLPAAKVLQIAQQLAAGLAAAHDAGVLHRDLKPANVMIDGAGNVRMLDFGIASAVDDERALRRLSGTPGFLAPELLSGEPPSPRSDLFSWGIVLFYAATGKLPAARSAVSHGAASEQADDALRSAGLPPELGMLIRRCLEADPTKRPSSAGDLVAGLANCEPLRVALEAGQIPEPDLVTTAATWQPSDLVLNALFGGGLAVLVFITLLADRTLFLSRCGLVKSPDALREIAEQTLRQLGHEAPRGPVQTGVALDAACLQYVRAHPEHPRAWQRIAAGEIPAVSFWYRQGDPRLEGPPLLSELYADRRWEAGPGTATVRLDGRGKLLMLHVWDRDASDRTAQDRSVAAPVSSEKLFDLAGLSLAEFHTTTPARLPPLFADEVRGWRGPAPFGPAASQTNSADRLQEVSVVAATLGGRVVFFEVIPPWQASAPLQPAASPADPFARFMAVRTAFWILAFGAAAWLAWRHAQQGHVDWRGAWRVSAAVLLLASLDWLCGSRHSFSLPEELSSAFLWLNATVFLGVSVGVAFLAVEPSARRWWPWSIITFRRLLDGRLADRAVWADFLLGLVVGLAAVFLRQLCTLLNQLLEVPVSGLNDFDPGQNLLDSFAVRYKASVLITALLFAVIESLLLLTLVVGLKRWIKSTLAAAALLVLVLAALAIIGRGIVSPIDWLARLLLLSLAAWLLLRFGLVATITALATFYLVNNTPITLDAARWYAPTGFFVLGTVAALLAACWRAAGAFSNPSNLLPGAR